MDSPITQRKKLAAQKPAPEPLGPSDAFVNAVGAAEPGKVLLTGGSNVQSALGFKDPESRAAYESWAATKLIAAAHERHTKKEEGKKEAEKKASLMIFLFLSSVSFRKEMLRWGWHATSST